MKPINVLVLLVALLPPAPRIAQATAHNSNYWPVFHDRATGFRISYPPSWVVVQPKGPNVRFSVNPPDGPGNCNVTARANKELMELTQAQINLEVASLSPDPASWATYIGMPASQLNVIHSRTAHIHDVPALVGIIETSLENLRGRFTRVQMVALTFTPGIVWSINCGASTATSQAARRRFDELRPVFNKVFGSFVFLR